MKNKKMNNMEEKTNSSEIVFKGKLLDVRRDIVILPNGNTGSREWINHPGAVCCVPLLSDDKIALIKQYRYPLRKVMIELPAGKLDKGENPEICAIRELEEEIGYKANKLTFLTNIHPAIGFANEKMWLYFAEDLEKTNQKLDSDEFLEIIPTKLEDALEMVWNGSITDVKTIIGLIWTDKVLK
tara:strand:- start:25 stop:576 length:552 start_codon:yes stop_codon:yes gene_type:complete